LSWGGPDGLDRTGLELALWTSEPGEKKEEEEEEEEEEEDDDDDDDDDERQKLSFIMSP